MNHHADSYADAVDALEIFLNDVELPPTNNAEYSSVRVLSPSHTRLVWCACMIAEEASEARDVSFSGTGQFGGAVSLPGQLLHLSGRWRTPQEICLWGGHARGGRRADETLPLQACLRFWYVVIDALLFLLGLSRRYRGDVICVGRGSGMSVSLMRHARGIQHTILDTMARVCSFTHSMRRLN